MKGASLLPPTSNIFVQLSSGYSFCNLGINSSIVALGERDMLQDFPLLLLLLLMINFTGTNESEESAIDNMNTSEIGWWSIVVVERRMREEAAKEKLQLLPT